MTNRQLELSEKYIKDAASIYYLIQMLDEGGIDGLVKLFKELIAIIFYGNMGNLIDFAHKAYDLNIQVHGDDPLGRRIKNFITLYLNDVIEKSLIDEWNR